MYPGPDPGVPNRSKYEKTKKILEGEASPRGQKSEVLKNKYYNLFTGFVPNPSKSPDLDPNSRNMEPKHLF